MSEKKARILFVDDEEMVRINVKQLLEYEGYDVDAVENGIQGIQRLEEQPYDLVITDLMMPGIDGIGVMKYINEHLPNTMVILITGYASIESAIKAVRQGAYDYVTKPLDFDFLKISIQKALEKIRLKRNLKRYYEHLEDRIRDRTRALKEAQEQLLLTENLAAIGEIAAGVAHEIKNPLVSIGGVARMLQRKVHDQEKVKELAGIIVEEVDRLERILKSLLDLSRDPELALGKESLNELIRKTCILFEPEMRDMKIEVGFELDTDLPDIFIDRDQIKQVVMNITKNAIHSMPDGGRIAYRTWAVEDEVSFAVSDTGDGISKENQDKLFTPFFSTKSWGTGLGLAVSQKLVANHGGRIEVESELGEGSTFTVTLLKGLESDLTS